jgi:hypothetical protein
MRFGAWVVVLALALAACTTVRDSKPDCEDDEGLCPASRKTATRVACNCTCELPHIPLSGVKNQQYRGKLVACLPPTLNPSTGTEAERAALSAMPQGRYNQEVFKFCSDDVADWLSLTIKSQISRLEQIPAGLACQPYKCTCSTEGARISYGPCEQPCDERACDKKNCLSILRQGGILDPSSCLCTRTEACGFVSPPSTRSPLCRPLLGPLDPNMLEDRNRSALGDE